MNEFVETPLEGGLIDILEIISYIRKYKKFDEEKLRYLKKNKFNEKGEFNNKIILEEVE